MKQAGLAMVFTVLALSAANTWADDPVKVPRDDVRKAIEGKTMVYTAPNGQPQRVYYSADGKLTGRGSGTGKSSQSTGEWTIEDDGKVCQKIAQGPMTDRCYYLMRADGALSISAGGNRSGVAVTFE